MSGYLKWIQISVSMEEINEISGKSDIFAVPKNLLLINSINAL